MADLHKIAEWLDDATFAGQLRKLKPVIMHGLVHYGTWTGDVWNGGDKLRVTFSVSPHAKAEGK